MRIRATIEPIKFSPEASRDPEELEKLADEQEEDEEEDDEEEEEEEEDEEEDEEAGLVVLCQRRFG